MIVPKLCSYTYKRFTSQNLEHNLIFTTEFPEQNLKGENVHESIFKQQETDNDWL